MVVGLWSALHLRTLTADEVQELAAIRRSRAVRGYYAFKRARRPLDLDFKRRMSAPGRFYTVSEPLDIFPATAAGHLKYKKHEWVLVAFEQSREVSLIWLNKGEKHTVSSNYGFADLAQLAAERGDTSVLVFHNRPGSARSDSPPHSRRSNYRNFLPSTGDIALSQEWGRLVNEAGVTLVAFVCHRGIPSPYKLLCPDSFLPPQRFADAVCAANGRSRWWNLRLHCERMFRGSGSQVAMLGDY
jgi:hypothetical protein